MGTTRQPVTKKYDSCKNCEHDIMEMNVNVPSTFTAELPKNVTVSADQENIVEINLSGNTAGNEVLVLETDDTVALTSAKKRSTG